MKSLSRFSREVGVPQSTFSIWVWKYPELQKYIAIEKRGLRHRYTVKDEEGLKEFLKRQGYTLRGPESV